MNIKKILFPTDLSKNNQAALEFASRLAAESGAVLYIMHADDMEEVAAIMFNDGYRYISSWEEDGRREAHRKLEQVLPTVPNVRYQRCYLRGSAAGRIVSFAKEQSVDLIVMASHGRTGLRRLLMGSTAENVLRQAPCPVLIVKQPAASTACEEFASEVSCKSS